MIAKLLEVCDARDGVADGMIFDVTGCTFRPRDLQCAGAKTEGCLSPEQVAAIEKGFAGPKDSRGRQVYPGWFYDTGITVQGGGIPGLLNPGLSPIGPPVPATMQDVDAEAERASNNPVSRVGDSYSWVNLNSFSSHIGKLIFYHGVSDPWFSAKDTIGYQRMTAANGGESKVMEWSRLFLSPGMGHCGGGSAALDSFDMLSAAVNWAEKGQAPEFVMATGRAFPGRGRPLCAYPAHAHDLLPWIRTELNMISDKERGMEVPKSKFSEGAIIAALQQLDAGRKAAEVAREVGVSAYTIYAWKAKYGGMDVNQAQEAKQLREENARLKKLVADLSLDKDALQSVIRKNGWSSQV